jgi:hydrogenase small subunit
MSASGTTPEAETASEPMEFEEIDVFWLPGEACDGCSVATLGATDPPIEDLLRGHVPHLPQVNLHHHELAVESGKAYVDGVRDAVAGERDPYIVVVEGSVPNERLIEGDGYWVSMGKNENGDPVRTVDWLDRLAPGATAVVAIGTCATWGGVPAAQGNVTDAMGTMDYLGRDYRSQLDLPVINVPGCAPVGANFIETVAHLLLHVAGFGPPPELDELGRPKWLFGETVHRNCDRGAYYEEGDFAEEYGSEKCLVSKGCWGPTVKCNMPSRRNLDGVGGCMNVGGKCIGCTMPGFPDKFTPFFEKAPGAMISTTSSKILGGIMSRLRRNSMKKLDKSTRWDESGGITERLYQWKLKRGANYDPDRGLERRPGAGDD